MNTKRMMRWIIVLFLLAALPGLTAVLAQGEEHGNTPMVRVELDGTYSPNLSESEPNNTFATADTMGLNDIIGATSEGRTFDDFFRFTMPQDGYLMIEGPYSYDWKFWTRLFDANFERVDMIDGGFYPEFFLANLRAGTYYIRMSCSMIDDRCDSQYYEIYLSSPLLISASAANLVTGNVSGVEFKSEDILAHSDMNNGEQRWLMVFDGSDVGITKNVTNIALQGSGQLLLTLAANMTLPGVGAVTPQDIFIFDPVRYGNDTTGTFRMGLKGSEHGLTTNTEKLDAIEAFTMGVESDPLFRGCFGFPVSTTGVATVNGPFGEMKQDDEDIFCKVYNPDFGGFQHWDWFFDVNGRFDAPASEPVPGNVRGLAGEDVIAMAYNDNDEIMYMTILGVGRIARHPVTQKDIFAINYPSYTWGGLEWHGPDHGWNYNIDAIEMGIQ